MLIRLVPRSHLPIYVPPTIGNQWYVATTGASTNNGSASTPWDLATALSGGKGAIQPGDVIWLRGGTYGDGTTTFTSQLAGALGSGINAFDGKIHVCQYPGERAILNGFLVANGQYTWFREFGITCSQVSPPNTHAVSDSGTGNKYLVLINGNSGGNAFSGFGTSINAEWEGNVVFYSGRQTATGGYAHSFYLQNGAGSTKLLKGNLAFLGLGIGLHIYGQAGSLDNITAQYNLFHNFRDIGNGYSAYVGGSDNATGLVLTDSLYLEDDGGVAFRIGDDYNFGGTTQATLERNFVSGGVWLLNLTSGTFQYNELAEAATNTVMVVDYVTNGIGPVVPWDHNTYWNSLRPDIAFIRYTGATLILNSTFAAWQTQSGKDGSSTMTTTVPTGYRVKTYAFQYVRSFGGGEIPVGVIAVRNYGGAGNIPVDLTTCGLSLNDNFKVYHEFDWIANPRGTPVASGVLTSATVNIPIANKTTPTPVSAPGGTPPAVLGVKSSGYMVVRV